MYATYTLFVHTIPTSVVDVVVQSCCEEMAGVDQHVPRYQFQMEVDEGVALQFVAESTHLWEAHSSQLLFVAGTVAAEIW